MSKLTELVETFMPSVARNVIESEELQPVFFLQNKRGEVTIAATPWRNESEKDTVLMGLKALFSRKGIVRYVTVSEAWTATYDRGIRPGGKDFRPPSQRDDREEVVVVAGADVETGEKIAQIYPIIRKSETVREMGKLQENFPAKGLEGRMLELLD